MSLIAKETGGGDYKLVPEGTHLARCYLLADIGFQQTNYGTKPKVVVGWEIPGETLDDGRPMSITAMYTNSLSELANLRKELESWRGKRFTEQELAGFDLRNVVGAPCMITVVHNPSNGKTYSNVTAVTSVPKGLPVADPINEPIVYDIDEGGSQDGLPEWIQKKIAESKSGGFSDMENTSDLESEELADVPF